MVLDCGSQAWILPSKGHGGQEVCSEASIQDGRGLGTVTHRASWRNETLPACGTEDSESKGIHVKSLKGSWERDLTLLWDLRQ